MKSFLLLSICVATVLAAPKPDDDPRRRLHSISLVLTDDKEDQDRYDTLVKLAGDGQVRSDQYLPYSQRYEAYPRHLKTQLSQYPRAELEQRSNDDLTSSYYQPDNTLLKLASDNQVKSDRYLPYSQRYEAYPRQQKTQLSQYPRAELEQRSNDDLTNSYYNVPLKMNVDGLNERELEAVRARVQAIQDRFSQYNPKYLANLHHHLRNALRQAVRSVVVQNPAVVAPDMKLEKRLSRYADKQDDREDDDVNNDK